MARRRTLRARIGRRLLRTVPIVVPIAALALVIALAAGYALADPLPGEALFVKNCGTCHVISATPEQRQGPNLYGVIGRPAGKLPGFTYSKALAHAKFTWTAEKIDAWITDPGKLVPGAVMMYRQADPSIRATIIDYLKSAGAPK
jgi:cytochrome c